jgi:hypothetical protein
VQGIRPTLELTEYARLHTQNHHHHHHHYHNNNNNNNNNNIIIINNNNKMFLKGTFVSLAIEEEKRVTMLSADVF